MKENLPRINENPEFHTIKKKYNKIILAMNKNGLTAEEIAKLTEIPLKEVQEMIRKRVRIIWLFLSSGIFDRS